MPDVQISGGIGDDLPVRRGVGEKRSCFRREEILAAVFHHPAQAGLSFHRGQRRTPAARRVHPDGQHGPVGVAAHRNHPVSLHQIKPHSGHNASFRHVQTAVQGMVVGQRRRAFQPGDMFLSPQFHAPRRKVSQPPECPKVARPVHQRSRAFRRHAAPCRGIISQCTASHTRRGSRPGQRRGRRRSAAMVARVSLARAGIGFLLAARFRRHHVDAVVADGDVGAFRLIVDVGLVDYPAVSAGRQLRPAGARVVFVAALLAFRLRVFLQVHLRHHLAPGVLHLQAPPVVHPQEERAGAVKFFAVRSFRDGEGAVGAVPVRRGAGRSYFMVVFFVDWFKRQRIGLRGTG